MKKCSLNNFNIRIDCNSEYWLYISTCNNEPVNVNYPYGTSIEDIEIINKITSLTDKYLKDIKAAISVHNTKTEKWLREHPEEQPLEDDDDESGDA